ncbi:uncharacterized protein BDZ99DRAFT_470937 [Mytilinidion resinicola]|uniref:Uncharacterized protein n=1 Tax=Mytilinidion resinicola TaxID=574789 RepID=A0A6A6ZBD3_9PEZI|nr:uncharacterized protein BDZ99DRAFT_470937 [Mytilinidion resinicola]KAF2818009.1 hypothetical protein BDZ99DRAFT_470937 [Mytilinidion resinicola]
MSTPSSTTTSSSGTLRASSSLVISEISECSATSRIVRPPVNYMYMHIHYHIESTVMALGHNHSKIFTVTAHDPVTDGQLPNRKYTAAVIEQIGKKKTDPSGTGVNVLYEPYYGKSREEALWVLLEEMEEKVWDVLHPERRTWDTKIGDGDVDAGEMDTQSVDDPEMREGEGEDWNRS